MAEAHELFSSLMEKDSKVHVELGDNSRYALKGEGTFMFHLDSGGLLYSHDVFYVPGLNRNFLSDLFLEERGFVIAFQRGKVLIHP
jgi:hypothetical protein